MLAVAEAEQDPGRDPGRRAGGGARAPAARRRSRRRPGSRPAASGSQLARAARRAGPSGPVTQSRSPGLERGRAARCPGRRRGPGSRAAARPRFALAVGDREGPGQVGPAVLAAPARLGGEHVELPGGRLGPVGVEHREDPVAAGLEVPGHLAGAPPERGRDPRPPGSRRSLTSAMPRGSCGSDAAPGGRRTSASPLRLGEDRARGGGGAGHRRHAGDAVADGRGADLVAVGAGARAGRGVDHQVHLAAADAVDDVAASPRRSS